MYHRQVLRNLPEGLLYNALLIDQKQLVSQSCCIYLALLLLPQHLSICNQG
ncbi:unnamed protein product [Staurois parvus]|uniref:Uncharacterized protein n=1 Tax=Staurois parvus TaxID=386267 RepID=A0ABN9C2C6_9NEOB|nr:unnamed protein product [Staurois parvus]